jgi:hypothetical protein
MFPASRSLMAGRAAAIGNFGHAELASEHQQLAEEMPSLALALMAVIDLSGINLRIGNEVLQATEGKIRARDQDERIGGQHADRLQRAWVERRFRK